MHKFYFYCIFIFATLYFPQSAQSVSFLSDSSCGLECWLANLTINIPTQSTVNYGFNFTIENMQCKGIQIGGIDSSFIPPTTLIVKPFNVSVMCQATWSYREVDWPHLSDSGTVYATVNDSSLLFGLALIQGANGLAELANTTVCDANITITNLTFTGGYSWVLNLFQSYVASTIQSELDTVTCQQLTNLVNVNLTQSLQQLNQLIAQYLIPQPPSPPPPLPDTGLINLATDSRIQVLEYIFSSLFTSTGELNFNTLVDRFTNGTGSVSFDAAQLDSIVATFPVWSSNVTYLGNITIGFKSINMSSLDTWGTDVNLSTVDNSTMRLHSDMSDLKVNVSFYLNISLGGDSVVAETLYEEGILSVDLKNNDFNLTFQLAIWKDKFDELEASQFQDIGCLLSTLYNINITQMFFNTTVATLAIDATNGDIEKDLDLLIDNSLDLFTSTYGIAIPAFLNAMASSQIKEKINVLISQEVIHTNMTCEPPEKDGETFNRKSTVYSMSAASALFAIFALALFWFVRRGKELDDEETQTLLWKQQEDTNPPLVLHPRLGLFTRLVIPFFLLFNVALFISSNTSVGASVFIILTSGDYNLTTPPLFQFSLGNSVRDMWNAGVYPLSILIAVFSGSWPYIKLLIMLVCWISKLPIKSREYLLMAIDMLGKWSLIDAFVMTLMMVAFQFHVGTGDVEGMSPANANVYVQPHWGFYMFLIATMLSLVLTHIILALHHHAVDRYDADADTDNLREALWYYAFKSEKSHKAWTSLKRYIVVLLLMIAFGLISWGAYTVSFAFNFKGAAGLLLQTLGEKTKTSYSVLSLGLALPGAAPPGGNNLIGVQMIEATFFTFTVAVPLVHLLVLLMLWVVPLSFAWQRKVFVLTEVLNAWSALEVFVISIIAAVLEIRQFAAFIVGDKCDPINGILKDYFNQDLDNDAKCFDVIATLEAGCWILFAACIIYLGVATLVMRVCHRAIKEHENKSEDGDIARIN